jgi:AbrB family looped-hinge helix DNA binding protein
MAIAHSKITAQGQISVPAEIRRKLGVGPGSLLEWEERGDEIIVRRARRYTSDDLHAAAFGDTTPQRRSTKEFKEGIRQLMRKRYALD